MKYRDYKIGFNYEVPDYYDEVREGSYEVFGVSPGTLHYFIMLDDEGEIVKNFSMSGQQIKDDKEYKQVVKEYIEALQDVDFVLIKENQLVTDSGKTIDRFVMFDERLGEEIGTLVYCMKVKDYVLTSCAYIKEYYDIYEEELFSIFNSIEEL